MHTHNCSKIKLFDMILSNKIFLDMILKNRNKFISRINQEIIIKQRVSLESLKVINSISKKHDISRDMILVNAFIILYENLSEKLNENIDVIKKLKIKMSNLSKNIDSIKKIILINKHSKTSYLNHIDDIKEINSKLMNIINKDIENYKKNSNN